MAKQNVVEEQAPVEPEVVVEAPAEAPSAPEPVVLPRDPFHGIGGAFVINEKGERVRA